MLAEFTPPRRCCATCTRSWWSGPERWQEMPTSVAALTGHVPLYVEPRILHCGAGVDDSTLNDPRAGNNPIWAERKYGDGRIRALLRGVPEAVDPPGIDCENMDPMDGESCMIWEPRRK